MISLEFCPCGGLASETIEWTLNATAAAIQNVRVDHCCPYVLVAEQFLDRTDAPDAARWLVRCRYARTAAGKEPSTIEDITGERLMIERY